MKCAGKEKYEGGGGGKNEKQVWQKKKKKSGTYLMCGKSPITSGHEREPRLHNYFTILPCNE